MARINIQLWDNKRDTDGERLRIIEEPDVDEPIGKTKARLRDRRRNVEADQIADTDKKASEVHVTKTNWMGRRERGIDPF
jgi:hypothetical protein